MNWIAKALIGVVAVGLAFWAGYNNGKQKGECIAKCERAELVQRKAEREAKMQLFDKKYAQVFAEIDKANKASHAAWVECRNKVNRIIDGLALDPLERQGKPFKRMLEELGDGKTPPTIKCYADICPLGAWDFGPLTLDEKLEMQREIIRRGTDESDD